MSGRKKLFILATLLSAILIISVVFSSGVVDVSTFSLGGALTPSPLTSAPEVFVDPDTIIKDYENDPGYQIGDTFQVHVNVTGVTDLFSWQLNMSWNPSMLNVSSIIAGEFLNRVTPPNYTTSSPAPDGLGFVINVTNNAAGYTAMGESILGGVPAISGSGRLVTIEFLITGYGCTWLTIEDVGGILPTTLLNSTGNSMTFTKTDGYFKNKLKGDSNGDGWVTGADSGTISDYWTGPPPGLYPYSRDVDNIDDGMITGADDGIVSDNWMRQVVLP